MTKPENIEQMMAAFKNTGMHEDRDITLKLLFLKCAEVPGHRGHTLDIPPYGRWSELVKLKSVGTPAEFATLFFGALEEIEKRNPQIEGELVLNETQQLTVCCEPLRDIIFQLVDSLPTDTGEGIDIFSRIYEALNPVSGGNNGVFFTPDCVARLLSEMLLPPGGGAYDIYDPCCGTGSMFVHAAGYTAATGGGKSRLKVYGQDSNVALTKLCRLNMALYGLDPGNVAWEPSGSLLKDMHAEHTFDFIPANPPFNQKNWGGRKLKDDPRWFLGTPPQSNGNFAWVLHCLSRLKPGGLAGIVLPNGSLTSSVKSEVSIREELVLNHFVDCIVALPDKLFTNTGISACIWILNNDSRAENPRGRKGEILFIDARGMGAMITRRQRILFPGEISYIADIYKNWRGNGVEYEDTPGRCRSAPAEEVARQGYALTPSRYIKAEPREQKNGECFYADLLQLYHTYKELLDKGIDLDNETIQNLVELTELGKK